MISVTQGNKQCYKQTAGTQLSRAGESFSEEVALKRTLEGSMGNGQMKKWEGQARNRETADMGKEISSSENWK